MSDPEGRARGKKKAGPWTGDCWAAFRLGGLAGSGWRCALSGAEGPQM